MDNSQQDLAEDKKSSLAGSLYENNIITPPTKNDEFPLYEIPKSMDGNSETKLVSQMQSRKSSQ